MNRTKKPDKKEKSPVNSRANKELKNIFSNKCISDRIESCNILFKDLSGLLEIREINNGHVNQRILKALEQLGYDPDKVEKEYQEFRVAKQKELMQEAI